MLLMLSSSVRTIQGKVDRTDPVLISLCSSVVQTNKFCGSHEQVEEDVGLSVGAAWIAGQDRSMWRTLRPSAGQAQQ